MRRQRDRSLIAEWGARPVNYGSRRQCGTQSPTNESRISHSAITWTDGPTEAPGERKPASKTRF